MPAAVLLLLGCERNTDSLVGASYEATEEVSESKQLNAAISGAEDRSYAPPEVKEKAKAKKDLAAPKKDNTKIIKTGEIGIQLADYHKNKHYIYDAIRKYEAYLSKENERTETHRLSNNIEIRVPNDKFEVLMDALTQGKGVANVDYKRMNTVDVSEAYFDLETRINTKKKVEERYIDILRQARKIEDILAVEEKIRVIREEIESAEGSLRYMSDRVSYSTISVYVYQDLEFDAPRPDRPTFWGKAGRAVSSGWNAILGFTLFLINIWPILLLVGAVLFAYRKKINIFRGKG